jgi:hypothetical protein
MNNHRWLKYAVMGLAVCFLSTQAPDVFAGPRGHKPHHAPAGHYKPVHRLPWGYTRLVLKGHTYYYHNGIFYKYTPAGYVIVPAPPGVVVPALPAPAPEQTDKTVVVDQREEAAKGIKEYEIHIPNSNGSYTLVVIKKLDKGFEGPQGEFYPEHPTVDQLKAMYAN